MTWPSTKFAPRLCCGALAIEGSRIRVTCDTSLTPSAAETLAANLVSMADEIRARGAR